jgi:acyl-CoA hydrolase
VRVESENTLTGEKRHTASAYFTFVALDDLSRPVDVPPITPETPLEQERFEAARRRRQLRLEHREQSRGEREQC